MTAYELSRQWFDFAFESPELINPNHAALYFFCIEHCNRLGWKEKFGLPSSMAKDAIGIKSYKTYIKTLNELVEWGFVKMVQKSTNQYSSNIVALVKNTKAHTKALDKAMLKHVSKQVQSISTIDKPNNLITNNNGFDDFWKGYPKKKEKQKCILKWGKMPEEERRLAIEKLPAFLAHKPFPTYNHPFPLTYLNGKRWEDEVPELKIAPPKKELTDADKW